MSTESDKSSDDDDNQHEDLEDSQEVLQAEAPFQCGAVKEESECDAGGTDTTKCPSCRFLVGCDEDVFAKDERVTGGPC